MLLASPVSQISSLISSVVILYPSFRDTFDEEAAIAGSLETEVPFFLCPGALAAAGVADIVAPLQRRIRELLSLNTLD